MPQGHTHTDPDGNFGVIWLGMREKNVKTPQEYAVLVPNLFDKETLDVKIKDVWVVPNYGLYLRDCLDKEFSM